MPQAVATMSQIEEGAQRMREIVGMIEDIAFQTNMLALNAAVEKFGVVVDRFPKEVRSRVVLTELEDAQSSVDTVRSDAAL